MKIPKHSRDLQCVPALLVIVVALLVGCSKPINVVPGKTTGLIDVGSPKVSTRARLLNDRLTQEAWLNEQLANTDNQVFGFQGLSDIRNFVGLLAKASVDLDPTTVPLYRKQQQQSLLDVDTQIENKETDLEVQRINNQIRLLRKQKELDDARNGVFAAPSETEENASQQQTNQQPGNNETSPIPSVPSSQMFE